MSVSCFADNSDLQPSQSTPTKLTPELGLSFRFCARTCSSCTRRAGKPAGIPLRVSSYKYNVVQFCQLCVSQESVPFVLTPPLTIKPTDTAPRIVALFHGVADYRRRRRTGTSGVLWRNPSSVEGNSPSFESRRTRSFSGGSEDTIGGPVKILYDGIPNGRRQREFDVFPHFGVSFVVHRYI